MLCFFIGERVKYLSAKRGRGCGNLAASQHNKEGGMASSFVPKGREELLLRTPLTFGFSAPTDLYQPRRSSVTSVR